MEGSGVPLAALCTDRFVTFRWYNEECLPATWQKQDGELFGVNTHDMILRSMIVCNEKIGTGSI